MTLILALRCPDGLVFAADSMSTEAAPQGQTYITRHEVDKLIIQDDLLWGCSGSVGIKQLIQETIRNNYKNIWAPHISPTALRKNLIDVIAPVITHQYRIVADASLGKGPIPHTNFIFGAYLRSQFALIVIECDMQGEVVEAKHCATGSGQKTGQALLRRLRDQDWDLRTAEVVAYRTMNDAIHVEPGGIGPPIKLARYYLTDGKPRIELIQGTDYDGIRDTAMAWTKLEQEVLQSLGKPKTVEVPQSPPTPKSQ